MAGASSILLGRRQMAALRAAEAGRLTRRYFSSSSATNSMPASAAASNTHCNNNQSQPTPTSNNRSINLPTAFALTGAALLGGYCLGTSHSNQWNEINKNRELPKGERGCCSCEDAPSSSSRELQLTESQTQLTSKLQRIVGKSHVHDGLKETSTNALFLKGERLGHGTALCIVQPGTIREAVQCLQEIVDAGCVVLPQGSNTGLTGG